MFHYISFAFLHQCAPSCHTLSSDQAFRCDYQRLTLIPQIQYLSTGKDLRRKGLARLLVAALHDAASSAPPSDSSALTTSASDNSNAYGIQLCAANVKAKCDVSMAFWTDLGYSPRKLCKAVTSHCSDLQRHRMGCNVWSKHIGQVSTTTHINKSVRHTQPSLTGWSATSSIDPCSYCPEAVMSRVSRTCACMHVCTHQTAPLA
jgi:hypothetical protein